MTKVKVFGGFSADGLEDAINEWLSASGLTVKIDDIKYMITTTPGEFGRMIDRHSALIIYKQI